MKRILFLFIRLIRNLPPFVFDYIVIFAMGCFVGSLWFFGWALRDIQQDYYREVSSVCNYEALRHYMTDDLNGVKNGN